MSELIQIILSVWNCRAAKIFKYKKGLHLQSLWYSQCCLETTFKGKREEGGPLKVMVKEDRFTKSERRAVFHRGEYIQCSEQKMVELARNFVWFGSQVPVFFNAIRVPQLCVKTPPREDRNKDKVGRRWEEENKNCGDNRFSQLKKILSSSGEHAAWLYWRYLKPWHFRWELTKKYLLIFTFDFREKKVLKKERKR